MLFCTGKWSLDVAVCEWWIALDAVVWWKTLFSFPFRFIRGWLVSHVCLNPSNFFAMCLWMLQRIRSCHSLMGLELPPAWNCWTKTMKYSCFAAVNAAINKFIGKWWSIIHFRLKGFFKIKNPLFSSIFKKELLVIKYLWKVFQSVPRVKV